MAFEPGGRADKLGNRYEGRWVAKQLLRLLNEEIHSVTIEAVGDDEKGVDLWVETKSGAKEAHQCKARNASKESWDVSDLNTRGVLQHLCFQLDRMPGHVFVFVSAVPAINLGDLCDSARNSNNPEDFYQFQVKDVGGARHGMFRQFCNYLGIDIDNQNDRSRAFNYLRRTYFRLFPDDENTREDLLTRAGFLLTGAPETIITSLSEYPENHDCLGKPIYADELRKYLETQGISPKNLVKDSRINPTIHQLRSEFTESIRPSLIDKELLHRHETDQCLEALQSNSVVILHGAAGSGKSSVLYEITRELEEKNIPFLPLRLDRKEPKRTAALFGQDMDLPDSPANCLAAVSRDRQCVLILDQLDAVRWTGRHSSNALDVCKEIVNQVISYRREGKLMNVILSCRTFDLEHNPLIRHWLNDQKEKDRVKIKVQAFSVSMIREKVGKFYEELTDRQREILSNPLHLGMWVELYKLKNIPYFQSSAELMKRFWEFRKQQLEEMGIPVKDVNTVLDCLVHWLDKNGKISAPDRIISNCSPKAVEALKSLGIIQQQDVMISFCHQSYLDYLIAQDILYEIDAGGTILDWLGPKDRQTLFRRDQFRQALTLQSNESTEKFLQSVKMVLSSGNIRFHLKHLALEVVGQIEDVCILMADYCLELLNDDYWRPHIVETVFSGNTAFIKILIDRGLIAGWLNSANNELIDQALKLLQSVAEKIPDPVTEQVKPFIDKGGEWPKRVLNTICWNINNDSEAMFELHLLLARKGILPNFIDWKSLCVGHPVRAIKLIEVILSTWDLNEEEYSSEQKISKEKLFEDYLKELSIVAEHYAEKIWEMFFLHIERLTSIDASPYDQRLERWKKDEDSSGYINMARAVVELLIIAGKKLAKEKPETLLKWTQPLENSASIIILEILMEVYPYLPAEYADAGVNWLLGDVSRFSCGDKLRIINKPRWLPAVHIIKALSPYCSKEVFVKLEQVIMHYHEPNVKELIKNDLKEGRNGDFDHCWYAQYFLLPALAPERFQNSTRDRISMLKRKFTGYPEWLFVGHKISFGEVIGSTLDRNLERISDRNWLNIIGNKDITENDLEKSKQISEDTIAISSVKQFSRSLTAIAKRYPERFGRLALRFPEDINPNYISAIFDAMAQTESGPEVPENEKNSWMPAAIDTILAAWSKFSNMENRTAVMSFCRLISSRANEEFPDSAIEKLLYYAADYPVLDLEKLMSFEKNVEEVGVESFFNKTFNCVRGVAAEAIGDLLWRHPGLWNKLKSGIRALVSDPHPVVRMAAIKTLLPVLNIDREQAVEWFCELSMEDLRVPASPYAIKFFNYTVSGFSHRLTPLVSRMINSNFADVSQRGAELATAYHLFYGFFSDELVLCSTGSVPQRKGVAKIAAEKVHDERYAEKCRELLAPLFNVPEKEVRRESSHIFKDNFFKKQANISLAEQFIRSKAFADHAVHFIYRLKDHKDSFLPCYRIILEICKVMATTLLEESRDYQSAISYQIAREITPLLLRLYDEAQENNREVANRCLDIWDEFFEKRVGITRDLTKAIENN